MTHIFSREYAGYEKNGQGKSQILKKYYKPFTGLSAYGTMSIMVFEVLL